MTKPPAIAPASDHESVYDSFARSAAAWPEQPFFHAPALAAKAYSERAITWHYGAAAARVLMLSEAFRQAGVLRGHRVALLFGNRAEFFLHYLALNRLGASAVPLSGESAPVELARLLCDSGAVLMLALRNAHDVVEPALAALTNPPLLAWHDTPEREWPRVDATAGARATASEDEAALLYTSGSTGAPKGCMLSNRYMQCMGRWYLAIGGPCALTPGRERLITPLPLVHMNALAASGMAMILSGGCIVQLDRFHPSSWWQLVRESEATVVHYLGVMPAMLLQASPSPSDRQHQVRFGFGAGVHPKHHAAFESRFGFPLVESWSMTEVGGGAAMIAAHEPRHVGTRCFGKPEAFMAWRVVDEEGRDVPSGTPGELWVRSAGDNPRDGFFSGYANQPALTEEAWAGGYFHTGDIVRVADDAAFHFVDRRKSIVRRSGENIASLEVEAVLNQLPMVRHVGVGPVDDELRGEEVMACIELAAGSAPSRDTAQAIFDAAAASLAYFKLPGYIAFVDALPLTSSQKLQRGELKQRSRALVDEGEAFDLRAGKRRQVTSGHA